MNPRTGFSLFTTITDHHWKVAIPMARARRAVRQEKIAGKIEAARIALAEKGGRR